MQAELSKMWVFQDRLVSLGKTGTSKAHDSPVKTTNTLPPVWRIIRLFQEKTGCFYRCRMPELLDSWAIRVYRLTKKEKWDMVVSTAGPYSVYFPALLLKKMEWLVFGLQTGVIFGLIAIFFLDYLFFDFFERYLEKNSVLGQMW